MGTFLASPPKTSGSHECGHFVGEGPVNKGMSNFRGWMIIGVSTFILNWVTTKCPEHIQSIILHHKYFRMVYRVWYRVLHYFIQLF